MSGSFQVDDLVIEWQRNKRRKRNVGFIFQPGGRLLLDAPPRTGEAELESMVREHIRWIRHKLRAAAEKGDEDVPLRLEDGALVTYLGKPVRVQWENAALASVRLSDKTLHVASPDEDDVRELVRDWFRERAAELFDTLLAGWQHLPWLEGKDVTWRQRYMKSQWGSCSVEGKISLNTHLAKVPRKLVDYVVLHELCHVKHMDHSRRFHALMDTHMPDWDQRRRGLNKYLGVLLGD